MVPQVTIFLHIQLSVQSGSGHDVQTGPGHVVQLGSGLNRPMLY